MAYQFECDRPDCDFLLRSSGEDEVRRLARSHVRDVHGEPAAPADIDAAIERVDAA